jgi:hypothetical protein
MTFDDLLRELREPPLPAHPADAWEASQACLPAARPAFLRAEEIRAAWEYGRFGSPLPPEVPAMADRIAADPLLKRLAWHAVWCVFEGPRDRLPGQWPGLQARLGDEAGLFWLLVTLAFVPAARKYHAALGLPEAVTADTCLQPACYAQNHRRGRGGRWGVYRTQFAWLANYMAPNLYVRVGRFEYWRRPWHSRYRVYRHRDNTRTVALAEDGVRVSAAGDRCFRPDDPEPAGSWRTSFREDAEGVTGNPVTPRGRVLREPVRLPPADWFGVLQPGDTVLDMHIPAGGGMTPAACAASFRDGLALFRTHFPEPRPRAIACASWMFSEQVEECLPPTANLPWLARQLYLLPHPCGPNDGLWFVFLQEKFDAVTAPRETSLQRALLDYLARGRPWHIGAMFLLAEDLERVGAEPYRCGTAAKDRDLAVR